MKSRRAYTQTVRAQRVAENEDRVLDAAERLFGTQRFEAVTLAAIAQAADVSIPTVQRRFGSKDDVFFAAAARVRARIAERRGKPASGDLESALRRLVDHYEVDGNVTWHFLVQESESPAVARMLAGARAMHHEWIESRFAEALARLPTAERRRTADALFAATDLFVWKLLRRDLGRSRAEVRQVMLATVRAIIGRE